MSVAIAFDDNTFLERAIALSDRYKLPIQKPDTDYEALLCLDETGLSLKPLYDKKLTPLRIDFEKLFEKRGADFGAKALLAKAVGYKGKPLAIIDATAGLGRDAFLLAKLGCNITLIERSPILAALLEDAISRACNSTVADIINRMTLVFNDAKNYFEEHQPEADAIYLDPMFPDRKKSALVKKDMQILQALLGHDKGIDSLLDCALSLNTKRVVVKRPKLDDKPALAPSLQMMSKTHRFDIYLLPGSSGQAGG